MRQLWRHFPQANPGLSTGIAFWVLDVDPRHGGDETLWELEQKHGKLPHTVEAITGGGGRHLYFAHHPGVPMNTGDHNRLGPGLDVRGSGGLVVAPGARHASGRTYEWEASCHPNEIAIEPAPEWLLQLVLPEEGAQASGPVGPRKEDGPPAALIPVLNGCEWLKHCISDATTLSEPEWYAMLGIAGRLEGGAQLAHDWSNPHPGYSPEETAAKLEHALTDAGPYTCRYIRHQLGGEAYCRDCPSWGKIKSPIVLGRAKAWTVDPPSDEDAPPERKREVSQDFTVSDGGEPARNSLGAEKNGKQPAQVKDPEPEVDVSVDAAGWPDPLKDEAFYGLAGEVVETILPHTEADAAAILSQFLVAFGNSMGRAAYASVGATRHTTNTNLVMVGPTGIGRKGTAWDEVLRLFKVADPVWARECIASGLSTGEGLINAVRDPSYRQEPIKNNPGEYNLVLADAGVDDKRLLLVEAEFVNTLKIAVRDGNTLSGLIRLAWESGNLRVLNKNSPLKATNAHISIIGHITREDLLEHLKKTDCFNGFANRFLWVAVRRSKSLPDGGALGYDDLMRLSEYLTDALRHGREMIECMRDEDAKALWYDSYEALSSGREGLWGAAIQRAAPQVLRLSLIYAAMNSSYQIKRPHLEAALAFWKYVEDSAAWVFGRSAQDPTADRVLEALRQSPQGLTSTDISNIFSRKKKSTEIKTILTRLVERGSVRCAKESTGGAPRTLWLPL